MKKYIGITVEPEHLAALVSATDGVETAAIAHITNARPSGATEGRASHARTLRIERDSDRNGFYVEGGLK